MFNCFDTKHTCDTQSVTPTDGNATAYTHANIASHRQKWRILWKPSFTRHITDHLWMASSLTSKTLSKMMLNILYLIN